MGHGNNDMLFMPPKQEESHMLRIEDDQQQNNILQNNILQNNPQQDNLMQSVLQQVEKPVEQQDEKPVEKQVEQIAISIQEQGLQNVNAVKKLVQDEDKQLKTMESKATLKQLLETRDRCGNNIDDRNQEALNIMPKIEEPMINIVFERFEEIDQHADNMQEHGVWAFDIYEQLDTELHPLIDAYVESKASKPVEQPKQEEKRKSIQRLSLGIQPEEVEEEEWQYKEETLSKGQQVELDKSKSELKKLVNINTDHLSIKALPIAKGYLNASEKFSSALVVNAAEKELRTTEEKKQWNALEYRYYNMLAQKRLEDMPSATAQRQKAYEQTAKTQQKINKQLLQESQDYQELNFGDIPAYVQDVLQDIHNIETDRKIVGLDQVGDQDVLEDIEAGTLELDQVNASKTKEVKVTQDFADAFGDIEAIEKTEETGLTEKQAALPQVTLSSSYVQAIMRLDSWLQGDDGKNLMSEVPETRQAVLNKLVAQTVKYNLDSKMFGEKSFEKNGEKIIEMALFIPGLLELVNQEGTRSGYNASGKQPVLDAMNKTAQTLYEGYSDYAKLHGLQLGNITMSEVKVENVYEGQKDTDLLESAERAHLLKDEMNYVSEDNLRDLAEIAVEPVQKSTQQYKVDAANNVKIVATRDKYDNCLASMNIEEQAYRQRKENGTLEVVNQKRKAVPQEQVEQAQQKVQAHMEAIRRQGGLQQEQSREVYTQLEQEVRKEVSNAPKQLEHMLENRLNMVTFDKKATAPLTAKELKEQAKQRKKAVQRTGSSMGVTHRTGVLLESIEQVKAQAVGPERGEINRTPTPKERQAAAAKIGPATLKRGIISDKIKNIAIEITAEATSYADRQEEIKNEKVRRLQVIDEQRDEDLEALEQDRALKIKEEIPFDENKYKEDKTRIEEQYKATHAREEAKIDRWFPAWRERELQKLERKHLKDSAALNRSMEAKTREEAEAQEKVARYRITAGLAPGISKNKAFWSKAEKDTLSAGTLDRISIWTSEKERNKLASLSLTVPDETVKGQTILKGVLKNMLKLNTASFSASFFTTNAQKILQYKQHFVNLEFAFKSFGLMQSQEGAALTRYMDAFYHLFNGFECFLQNNGLNLEGGSSFVEGDYASVDEYRAAYKTQVAKNTNNLQRHYNEYCKALQGNA